jgi:DNA-binding transcriptional LysR family regulator
MQLPSLKFLRTFHIAARRGSFKAAAEELFITASAVSHQMKQLESHLGVDLFDRTHRTLILTEAGAQFCQRLEAIFASLESATEQLRMRFARSVVRLNAPPFFANELLVPQLAGFSAAHPDVDIQISTRQPEQEGHAADTDISVAVGAGPWPQLTAARLFSQTFVPACAPHLLSEMDQGSHQPSDRHALIMHSKRPDLWDRWAAMHGIGALQPKQWIRFDSMASVVDAAESGVGVALVSAPISAPRFAAGTLARLSDHELTTGEDYFVLIRPEDAVRPPVRALVNWLTERFGSVPAAA